MPSDRQVIPTYKLLLVMYKIKIKIAMNKYFRVPGFACRDYKIDFIPIHTNQQFVFAGTELSCPVQQFPD